MLVRVNIGWKAGQVQDIEPVSALRMIADGRASMIRYGEEEKQETAEPVKSRKEKVKR